MNGETILKECVFCGARATSHEVAGGEYTKWNCHGSNPDREFCIALWAEEKLRSDVFLRKRCMSAVHQHPCADGKVWWVSYVEGKLAWQLRDNPGQDST